MNFLKMTLPTLSFLLAGCSSLGLESDIPEGRPYQNIDGEINRVIFLETNEYLGSKGELKHIAANQPLDQIGELHSLVTKNQANVQVILVADKKSYNPRNKKEMKELGLKKQFYFYDFGRGQVGQTRFTASNNICGDLHGKSGIKLDMAINYYADVEHFYTVSLSTNSRNPKDNYKQYFHSSDEKIVNQFKGIDREMGKEIINKEIIEKMSVLENIVCK
ncbi:hypothetical protein A4G19_03440 [Pasteurellaceae bacterium Macca]|nr:hypothetical protein [Pasteurellaceae bacterium Macca]